MSEHLNNALLIDYLRRELPPEDDALVLVHLEKCQACRREYEIEISLSESLRAAAAREELEFPSMVAARVWEEIRNARPSPLTLLLAWFRPAIAVPLVGAAALAAFFFAVPFAGHGVSPKINAAYYLEAHAALQAQNPLDERGPAAAQMIEIGAQDSSTPTELADDGNVGLAAPSAFDAVR
jgi:anti-sigma factor RsiW